MADKTIDNNVPSRYILDGSESFAGYCQTSTYTTTDGVERVAYHKGKTLAEYLAEFPQMRVVDGKELDSLLNGHYEDCKKGTVKEISEETYNDMLNVLPPCRWDGGSFHISERFTANLVSWYFRIGKKHYTLIDEADANKVDLCQRIIDEK